PLRSLPAALPIYRAHPAVPVIRDNANRTFSLFRYVRTKYTEAMSEPVTASELRKNVYRLIDRTLETGEPLEIRRGGRTLRLVPDAGATDRLGAIHTNPEVIAGAAEEWVSIHWPHERDADRAGQPRCDPSTPPPTPRAGRPAAPLTAPAVAAADAEVLVSLDWSRERAADRAVPP